MKLRFGCVVVGFLSLVLSMAAQTSGSSPASAQVPPLIQFANVATDEGGNSLSGVVSITFSLYNGQQGGEPLWAETQKVELDPTGHYSVQLGITQPAGVPTALFVTGAARWLGVRIAEEAEQPRVLLLSVPYALKAGDAATIGGLPPSAFVLAAPQNGAASVAATESATAQNAPPPAGGPVTGTGTANFVPLWDSASDIISSVLFQSGTGTTAKVGIGTATPATTLDVKGTGTIRGQLSILGTLALPAIGAATASAGKNSQPLSLAASAFSSSTSKAVNQTFHWQAEAAGNNTASPSGTLNLLFSEGTSSFGETGLNIASNGQIKFAPGQSFPGTGDGTITGVTAGTDLTGGGTSGDVTLNVDTTKVPQLNTANTFTGNQTVNGNVTATNVTATTTVSGGVVDGGVVNAETYFDLGGLPFAFGAYSSQNVFVGFSGNLTTTGAENTALGFVALLANSTGFSNTAVGYAALAANTTGQLNTASGSSALYSNTTGSNNTATGFQALVKNCASGACSAGQGSYNTANGLNALFSNTTGNYNTALGIGALYSNTTGSSNTALGNSAGPDPNDPSLSNSTAIGANADVTASNALVLGSINGTNGATADTFVGIGTTAPSAKLNVSGAESSTNGKGAAIQISNSATGGANYYFRVGATGTQTAAGGFSIANDNLYVMTITGGGQVGIQTQSPDSTLSVNGSADKTGGGSWGTFSDGRLKNLNGSYSSGLSQVLKIHPVRYRYKADNPLGIRDTDEHIGVVAQDVQKVIPEAVTENSKGYLLVNNDPIIWTMLNAIKEQQREIRALRSELRTTRQTLQKVKAQVAASQLTVMAKK